MLAPVASVLTLLLSSWAAGSTEEPPLVGPLAVAEVVAGDQLRLADGRAVRLAGIRVPSGDAGDALALAEQARAALTTLLEGQKVSLALAEAPYDRYGRLVAQIERGDGLWLQGALLERGLAQVQTRPGEAARADQMLAVERAARAARRGVWADAAFMALDASAARSETGRFRIVYGQVLRVAPTERFVYLNFGADWRRDFTVRIAKALADRLARSGLEVASLTGRRIEIRGLVLEAGGPLIELSHPEQMQLLP
ncbi:MAG: thermonuclease family protein [Geminicoccaceae bacterium]